MHTSWLEKPRQVRNSGEARWQLNNELPPQWLWQQCGCGKEEQSRRRQVQDPGTSALSEPIPTVIGSASIPPAQWPHSGQWSSRVTFSGSSVVRFQVRPQNIDGPGRPASTNLECSASKRDRNLWIFFFSCSVVI
jgi:hypothetical protein